ncbi:alpha/beta hydrolase family protein [Caenimonas terrae]|uniref:Alpha/beta hydrolase family protein n=1 Tax=Caenimonas terrae TaxID=696074 RepID=A0ABW0NG71_9BURK
MTMSRACLAGATVVLGWMLCAGTAFAAGIQSLAVPAAGASPALSGAVWYPCALAPTELQLGPFRISAVKDCPLAGRRLPLIVISHGMAGSFLGHRDTAQALADAGFIVAAISHPGDSAQDSSSTDELSVFVRRPEDIRRVVDHLLGAAPFASAIDPDRIGLFGFSRGGYTGLVLAGAVPVFGRHAAMCEGRTDDLCAAVRSGQLAPPVQDGRIRAAVIADPLALFFGAESFGAVGIPIQLWRSEFGGQGVTPAGVGAVAAALPARPAIHTVAGAGHFAFLPPCPPQFAQALPELCQDRPGFDRKAFHDDFNAQVVDFFRRSMP